MKKSEQFRDEQEFIRYLIRRENFIGSCIGISAGLIVALLFLFAYLGLQ